MKFVSTADIDIIGKGKIFTMGLSTCMCFVVITKNVLLCGTFHQKT